MPAASRRIEFRPSAAIATRAEMRRPSVSVTLTPPEDACAPAASAPVNSTPSSRARSNRAGIRMPSGKFQPKASSPSSAGSKVMVGALNMRARVVDEAEFPQGLRPVLQRSRPQAQMREEPDRGLHQRHGARVAGIALLLRHQRHAPPVQRQKAGGGKACGAGTRHDHIEFAHGPKLGREACACKAPLAAVSVTLSRSSPCSRAGRSPRASAASFGRPLRQPRSGRRKSM